MVVLHCVLRLRLWTLDCADAFLQVPQQERCIVEIPAWIKKLLGYTQELEEMFARAKECRFGTFHLVAPKLLLPQT